MDYYKDFNYATYILHCDFDTGYKLFIKLREKEEKKHEERLWDLFLIEVQNGYKEDFNTYMKTKKKNTETMNMSKQEKNAEENKIKGKFKDLHKKSFKKKEFKL